MIKITLVDRKFENSDLNKTLQNFCDSFGLFSAHDKEKSCFRVFIEIIKAERDHDRLSSDEIAENANLSRATVIHHIEKLENSGLISSKKNRYFLAKSNLEAVIEIMEKEFFKIFKDQKKRARKIDKETRLK